MKTQHSAPKPWHTTAWALLVTTVASFAACTDVGLQAKNDDEIKYVDDKLAVTGQYCTNPARDVPFPVKVLIVMDQSGSLQLTDPGNRRLTAMNAAGSALAAQPNVEFGVIGFSNTIKELPFTSSWADAAAALSPEGGAGGPATDYQGALATTLRYLEDEMYAAGWSENASSKYVVLFVSDGNPEPQCKQGCGDAEDERYIFLCEGESELDDNEFPGFPSGCPDYNQPAQIKQKVEDIMSLSDFYGVGDMTFNSIFLFNSAADPTLLAQFGYNAVEAKTIMSGMAEVGRGVFRDMNLTEDIDFLQFDYESLKAPYRAQEFFAVNLNSLPGEKGFLVDSDGDGVDDETEFELGLNRMSSDSDGDGFSDLFELRYSSRGFDPKDPKVPLIGCAARGDTDRDMLADCEERYLHSDPLNPDSDGDRVPDGIELRFGLDPITADMLVDYDFDGSLSGEEVRAGTNPMRPDDDVAFDRVLYSVDMLPLGEGSTDSGIDSNTDTASAAVTTDSASDADSAVDDAAAWAPRCYDFKVQNITLVPTVGVPGDPSSQGRNRILLFKEEEPYGLKGGGGLYHVACVEARYLGDTFKDPPSGKIDSLPPLFFVPLATFDPALHCLKVGQDPNAEPDGGVP